MKKRNMNQQGFTLVELVLVIIIIGILAALAIPQFTSSTDDAREATIKSNLAVLRNALQLFYHEHNSTYPSGTEIADQLTEKTQLDGTVAAAGEFGPYLVAVPDNPAKDAASDPAGINAVASEADLTTVTGTGGWNYHPGTGKITANSDGHTDF